MVRPCREAEVGEDRDNIAWPEGGFSVLVRELTCNNEDVMATIEGHYKLPVPWHVLPTCFLNWLRDHDIDIVFGDQRLLRVGMRDVKPSPSPCSVICRAWLFEIAESLSLNTKGSV